MGRKKIIDLSKPMYISTESFSDMVSKATIDQDTKTCEPLLMELDTPSRNGSAYCGKSIKENLESSIIVQEGLKTGCWFGEMGHPDPKTDDKGNIIDHNRFLKVEPDNISHRIINYWYPQENLIKGKIGYCGPKGDIAWNWVLGGSNLAFSIRALTPTYMQKESQEGHKYVFKYGQMHIVTFDCVFLPGFRIARMVDVDNYDARTAGAKLSSEDFSPHDFALEYLTDSERKIMESVSTEDWNKIINSGNLFATQFHYTSDMVKDMLVSEESLSLRMLEDTFGFDFKDAQCVLLKDNKVQIKPSASRESLVIPYDTYLMNSIMQAHKHKISKSTNKNED